MSFVAIASAQRAMRAEKKAKRAIKAKRITKAKRLKLRKPSHAEMVRKADKAFSLRVRECGLCESGRPNHAGPLQCAHGFSRRYHATRWQFRNAFSLCAGCHVFFTHRPIEWDEWIRDRMGADRYESLRQLALHAPNPDMAEVLRSLA